MAAWTLDQRMRLATEARLLREEFPHSLTAPGAFGRNILQHEHIWSVASDQTFYIYKRFGSFLPLFDAPIGERVLPFEDGIAKTFGGWRDG